MLNLVASIQNSPGAIVSIIFLVGFTVGVWGIPLIKQFVNTDSSI